MACAGPDDKYNGNGDDYYDDMARELVEDLLHNGPSDTYRPKPPCTYEQWTQLLPILGHADIPPACFAAQNRNAFMLEDLLADNPNCLLVVDNENNNPIHHLASSAHGEPLSALHLLLDNGADPLAKNNEGLRALDVFAQHSKQTRTSREINIILEKHVLDQVEITSKRKNESHSLSL